MTTTTIRRMKEKENSHTENSIEENDNSFLGTAVAFTAFDNKFEEIVLFDICCNSTISLEWSGIKMVQISLLIIFISV